MKCLLAIGIACGLAVVALADVISSHRDTDGAGFGTPEVDGILQNRKGEQQ